MKTPPGKGSREAASAERRSVIAAMAAAAAAFAVMMAVAAATVAFTVFMVMIAAEVRVGFERAGQIAADRFGDVSREPFPGGVFMTIKTTG